MRYATYALSILMFCLGVAIITRTLTRGGGPLATGLLVGVLLVAAGLGRLYVERGRG